MAHPRVFEVHPLAIIHPSHFFFALAARVVFAPCSFGIRAPMVAIWAVDVSVSCWYQRSWSGSWACPGALVTGEQRRASTTCKQITLQPILTVLIQCNDLLAHLSSEYAGSCHASAYALGRAKLAPVSHLISPCLFPREHASLTASQCQLGRVFEVHGNETLATGLEMATPERRPHNCSDLRLCR